MSDCGVDGRSRLRCSRWVFVLFFEGLLMRTSCSGQGGGFYVGVIDVPKTPVGCICGTTVSEYCELFCVVCATA